MKNAKNKPLDHLFLKIKKKLPITNLDVISFFVQALPTQGFFRIQGSLARLISLSKPATRFIKIRSETKKQQQSPTSTISWSKLITVGRK